MRSWPLAEMALGKSGLARPLVEEWPPREAHLVVESDVMVRQGGEGVMGRRGFTDFRNCQSIGAPSEWELDLGTELLGKEGNCLEEEDKP